MESGVEKTEPDDLLKLVKGQYDEFADATLSSRAEAEKCRRYRDGEQWTADERETLKKRKQPCITDNKIQDKCDTLLGIEKQQRTDPKAFPRNPDDEESAEAATDSLRFVADSSDYHRTVRKPASDNLMVEGLCIGQVIVEKVKAKQPKVCMEHIRWDRGYYDIHSLREDFADKEYAGLFTWMDLTKAQREFGKSNKRADKDALDNLEASFGGADASRAGTSADDKPRYVMVSNGRKRVQVFETYFMHEGVWKFGKWCRGGWLEAATESSYKDENGEPSCCIELQALYRAGDDASPYGAVQRYIDLQDEHNKRRSKMLHLLNAKRLIVQRGAFEDINKARAELHKPDGVLESNFDIATSVRVEDNLAEADGQLQLLQQTDFALSQTGPNAALAGLSGDISGRAKQLDQNAGTLPISPLFDALDSWEMRMYRQVWNRVRQFWKSEMWVRVTDNEKNVKFAPLNKPTTQGEILAGKLKRQQLPDDQKAAIVQEIHNDPASQTPAIQNNVAEMDVDIIIDRNQDTVNVQQEQFEVLAGIAEKRPEIPFDIIIEMSQLRSETKKRILERLQGMDNPQAQQMAALQQRLATLEAAQKEADVVKTHSEIDLNEAKVRQIGADTTATHVDSVATMSTAMNPDASLMPPHPKPEAEAA